MHRVLGNREWHVVVEHAGLAKLFEAYINFDYEQSEGFVPKGLQELYEVVPLGVDAREARRTKEATLFCPLNIDREVDVQPILTPDNYVEHVQQLLDGAKESIWFQNQYINESKDSRAKDNYVKLVQTLGKKQKDGLDVRIILRGERGVEARHIEFMRANGLDVDAIRWRDATHTKGIIVDGKRVLLGSHNWSFDGVKLNRDASLLFFDEELAEYFSQIYLYDWENWSSSKVYVANSSPEVEELSTQQVRDRVKQGDVVLVPLSSSAAED